MLRISLKVSRWIPLASLLWVLLSLCSILYILKNQEDSFDEDTIKTLNKEQDNFVALESQYTDLQKLVLRYKQSIENNNREVLNVPTVEYEVLRRRMVNDVQEFWYFMDSELSKLTDKVPVDSDLLLTIERIVSMGIEYKRAFINNMNKIRHFDGFNKWRKKEIASLSKIVQRRLYHLQHPKDCQNAKKILCSINYSCGFGCQIHHLVSCMILAYGLQRTLILQSKGWQYHKKGWEDIFKPLSNSCINVDNTLLVKWPGNESSQVLVIPTQTSILPRSNYLPLAVPEDLAVRLKAVHGNPIVWWVGQILHYIWKPQNSTSSYIRNILGELKITSPFVGIHIRRTDKIGREASYHDIEEYMNKVDEYYNQIEINSNLTNRSVYIATDDYNAIQEAKTKFPHYQIFYNHNIPKRHHVNSLHSNDKILDVILDVHILSQSSFLVCTLSSNICRLAYELMQNNNEDSTEKIASLDDVYYYSQQEYNKRIAILKHKSRTSDEIDLTPGDFIHMAGNHWNGYSLGTNLRTGKKGLFPSFKVEIEPEIVNFPKYSDTNDNDV